MATVITVNMNMANVNRKLDRSSIGGVGVKSISLCGITVHCLQVTENLTQIYLNL